MSSRLPTIFDDLFPDSSPEFAAIADAWPSHVVDQMLTLVWEGFDRLKSHAKYRELDFTKDYVQLERSLTDLHMDEITVLWGRDATRFESFIPKHEPWEWQGLKKRSARPPSCDLGFVLLSNRRIRWAVEAKVLATSANVAEYLADLQKYLDGRSAPFSGQSALGGYLVTGEVGDAIAMIARKCGDLKTHESFSHRPHRCSEHTRSLDGVNSTFTCHHLLFSLN